VFAHQETLQNACSHFQVSKGPGFKAEYLIFLWGYPSQIKGELGSAASGGREAQPSHCSWQGSRSSSSGSHSSAWRGKGAGKGWPAHVTPLHMLEMPLQPRLSVLCWLRSVAGSWLIV